MASPKTRITPNSFLTKVGSSKDGEPILVYFVPGNPGVVSYYHYFLSLVASNLSSSGSPSETFASLASEQLQERTGSGTESSNSSGRSTPTGRSNSDDGNREEEGERESRSQSPKARHSPRIRLPLPRRKSSKKHRKHQHQSSGDESKSDHDSLSSRKKDLWNYPNTNNNESYLITGRSLAGFEIEDDASYLSSYLSTINAAVDTTTTAAYSLDEQVQHVERNLAKFVRKYQDKVMTGAAAAAAAAGQEDPIYNPRPKVILMGHSMGSYISMEILRRRREREVAAAKAEAGSKNEEDIEMDIIGALMLFPTVVDIAKSPSGKRMTVRDMKLWPFWGQLQKLTFGQL